MAAESSEQGSRNASLYRLGVRLRALELLISYAHDADELAFACRYVRLASNDIRACNSAPRLQWPADDARDLLRRLHRGLQNVRRPASSHWECDTDPYAKEAAEIIAIVRDSLCGAEADWFELGCAVVPLSSEFFDVGERSIFEWPGSDVDARDVRHKMTWLSIRRLEAALRKTGVSLDDCLIEPDYDAADRFDRIARYPDALWPLEWIERALETVPNDWADRNHQRERDEGEPLKPASERTLRNLNFLAWYEDESSETHNSPAKIRDRWNAAHPEAKIAENAKDADTVKKGVAAAKRYLERNRVELYDAIEQLEKQDGTDDNDDCLL